MRALPRHPSDAQKPAASRTVTSALSILLPLFALIAAGYLARRARVFDASASSTINRFVVWLALPAALFGIMAHSTWAQLWQPRFIAAFGIATLAVFIAVLALRLRGGRHLADASVDAVAASYSNTAYVGLPLCLLVFGHASQMEATVATILVVCVLFSLAVVLVEVGLGSDGPGLRTVVQALARSLRNPIVLAPLLGAAFAATGLPLPGGVDTFLHLLGQAATPCALVGLGAFMADRPAQPRGQGRRHRTSLSLTAAKLLALPALTWWLAQSVFQLPAAQVHMAVLLAALPTGTGPFMLAEFYRREAAVTSATTLLTTAGSVVTLSGLLVLFA